MLLPDALLPKLRRFWNHKVRRGESLDPDAPLVCSWPGRRISKRRVQILLAFRLGELLHGMKQDADVPPQPGICRVRSPRPSVELFSRS